ncbi:MAG: hypothetical protein FWF10_00905 [Clostridiales bacterium]|nr:hypothetical protein [Clostridiales bacterium]
MKKFLSLIIALVMVLALIPVSERALLKAQAAEVVAKWSFPNWTQSPQPPIATEGTTLSIGRVSKNGNPATSGITGAISWYGGGNWGIATNVAPTATPGAAYQLEAQRVVDDKEGFYFSCDASEFEQLEITTSIRNTAAGPGYFRFEALVGGSWVPMKNVTTTNPATFIIGDAASGYEISAPLATSQPTHLITATAPDAMAGQANAQFRCIITRPYIPNSTTTYFNTGNFYIGTSLTINGTKTTSTPSEYTYNIYVYGYGSSANVPLKDALNGYVSIANNNADFTDAGAGWRKYTITNAPDYMSLQWADGNDYRTAYGTGSFVLTPDYPNVYIFRYGGSGNGISESALTAYATDLGCGQVQISVIGHEGNEDFAVGLYRASGNVWTRKHLTKVNTGVPAILIPDANWGSTTDGSTRVFWQGTFQYSAAGTPHTGEFRMVRDANGTTPQLFPGSSSENDGAPINVAAAGHTYGTPVVVAATCVATGSSTETCSVCNHVNVTTLPIEPTAHVWGAWVEITPPTTATTGLERRECTHFATCGGFEQKVLPKITATEWVRITNMSEVTDGSKIVIAARVDSTTATSYNAMRNNPGSGGNNYAGMTAFTADVAGAQQQKLPSPSAVISAGTHKLPSSITSAIGDYYWVFNTSGSGYTLTAGNSNNKLVTTGTTTGITLSPTGVPWYIHRETTKIRGGSDYEGFHVSIGQGATDRHIAYNDNSNDPRFNNVSGATNTINTAPYTFCLDFFKEVPVEYTYNIYVYGGSTFDGQGNAAYANDWDSGIVIKDANDWLNIPTDLANGGYIDFNPNNESTFWNATDAYNWYRAEFTSPSEKLSLQLMCGSDARTAFWGSGGADGKWPGSFTLTPEFPNVYIFGGGNPNLGGDYHPYSTVYVSYNNNSANGNEVTYTVLTQDDRLDIEIYSYNIPMTVADPTDRHPFLLTQKNSANFGALIPENESGSESMGTRTVWQETVVYPCGNWDNEFKFIRRDTNSNKTENWGADRADKNSEYYGLGWFPANYNDSRAPLHGLPQGHTWGTPIPATCLEGSKKVCTVCGYEEPDGITGPLGHDWTNAEWYVVTPATCIADGLEQRDCQRQGCTHFETQPIAMGAHNHTVVVSDTATCTAPGQVTLKCSACTDTIQQSSPALGHDYGAWTVQTIATATTPGIEKCDCSRKGLYNCPTLTRLYYLQVADDGKLYRYVQVNDLDDLIDGREVLILTTHNNTNDFYYLNGATVPGNADRLLATHAGSLLGRNLSAVPDVYIPMDDRVFTVHDMGEDDGNSLWQLRSLSGKWISFSGTANTANLSDTPFNLVIDDYSTSVNRKTTIEKTFHIHPCLSTDSFTPNEDRYLALNSTMGNDYYCFYGSSMRKDLVIMQRVDDPGALTLTKYLTCLTSSADVADPVPVTAGKYMPGSGTEVTFTLTPDTTYSLPATITVLGAAGVQGAPGTEGEEGIGWTYNPTSGVVWVKFGVYDIVVIAVAAVNERVREPGDYLFRQIHTLADLAALDDGEEILIMGKRTSASSGDNTLLFATGQEINNAGSPIVRRMKAEYADPMYGFDITNIPDVWNPADIRVFNLIRMPNGGYALKTQSGFCINYSEYEPVNPPQPVTDSDYRRNTALWGPPLEFTITQGTALNTFNIGMTDARNKTRYFSLSDHYPLNDPATGGNGNTDYFTFYIPGNQYDDVAILARRTIPAELNVQNLGAQAKTDYSALRYGARLDLKLLQANLEVGDVLVFGIYDMMLTTYMNGQQHLVTGGTGSNLRRVICSDGTNDNSGTNITWTQAMEDAVDADAWLQALRAAGRTDVMIFSAPKGQQFIDYCVVLDGAVGAMQLARVVFMPFVQVISKDDPNLTSNAKFSGSPANDTLAWVYTDSTQTAIAPMMKHNSIKNIIDSVDLVGPQGKSSKRISYPFVSGHLYNESYNDAHLS